MTLVRSGVAAATALLLLRVALVLGAQEAAQEEVAPEAASPAAEAQVRTTAPDEFAAAIPQAAVLTRADEVAANLRRLAEMAESDDYLALTSTAADADGQALAEIEREIDVVDTVPVAPARLTDLEIALARLQQSIAARSEDVGREWSGLRDEIRRLADSREVWVSTRARALAMGYPAQLSQRIDQTIADQDAMIGQMDAVNTLAASLADRVSRQNDVALRSIARLNAISQRLTRGIFDRDPTRAYQLLAGGDRRPLMEQLREAGGYWWETLRSFVRENAARAYFLLALCLSILAVALWLHRRRSTWPADDPALADARAVVARPLALAFLFSAVLVRFVLPDPVRSVQDTVILVAIFALLRLGPTLLHPSLHRGLFAFTLIYLVNMPWQFLPAASIAGQWMLAAGILVALACVAYVIAGFESARQILGPRSWRIAYVGLILAEVGFTIGLIVGAMGWIRLTRFVAGGVVLAVFGAIAWRVIYKAAVAVLPFLIRAPLAHVGEGSRRQEPLLRRVAAALIAIFAVYRYGTSVLEAFRLLTPLRNRVDTVLSASYDWGGLELSLGSTLAALTILIFTPILSRIVRFVLREEIAPRLGIAHGVDYTLTTLSGYAVWVLGIVAAANAAGVSGTQMTVLFGALGVGLGFGLQAIVNNFVSGLILMFERPLAVGDRIQTATQAGTVTAIGIRASNIRTFSGADVVVPNGDLITKEVINWTLSDDIRRVEIKVSTSYGTRPRQVLEILTRLAADHPKVLDEPAFAAVMHSFGESALNFELRAWVGGNDFVSVASELHVLVEEALTGAGIDLVVPRREVLLRNEKDETEGS